MLILIKPRRPSNSSTRAPASQLCNWESVSDLRIWGFIQEHIYKKSVGFLFFSFKTSISAIFKRGKRIFPIIYNLESKVNYLNLFQTFIALCFMIQLIFISLTVTLFSTDANPSSALFKTEGSDKIIGMTHLYRLAGKLNTFRYCEE